MIKYVLSLCLDDLMRQCLRIFSSCLVNKRVHFPSPSYWATYPRLLLGARPGPHLAKPPPRLLSWLDVKQRLLHPSEFLQPSVPKKGKFQKLLNCGFFLWRASGASVLFAGSKIYPVVALWIENGNGGKGVRTPKIRKNNFCQNHFLQKGYLNWYFR